MKPAKSLNDVKRLPPGKERFSEVMTVAYEQNIAPTLVLAHRLPLEMKINLTIKRLFDLLFSSIFLVLILSWMIPLVALLIKLDSQGPVFFLQKRYGRNGRLFTCIKFRTMIVNHDADRLPALVDDSRITKLGAFLRKNHLDELPQLLNVWLGEMSLIGPRPHMISDNLKYEELLKFYSYRHKVKPGLTGWAQVHGYVGVVANLEAMRERVKKDIYYIHHWSLMMDARIIGMTLFKMFPPSQKIQN